MPTRQQLLFLMISVIFVLSCNARITEQNSDLLKSSSNFPTPANWRRGALKEFPKYNPSKPTAFNVDLRSYNLSKQNLESRYNDLLYADFNTKTVWSDILPKGYNPNTLMEIGKNPGLGIRELHKEGVTGKGVSIAIIDQRLLRTHKEYSKQLKLYKEFGYKNVPNKSASMHGSAVSSIAVGKTCGVAPDANLYYFAANNMRMISKTKYEKYCNDYTKAINYILKLNQVLPVNQKIRVISISWGYEPGSDRIGMKEYVKAINSAKKQNILVVTTSLENTYDYGITGLGRTGLDNPDKISSFAPGIFYSKAFFAGNWKQGNDNISIPMDCRTTASPLSNSDYVYYSNGGLSWSVPWLAGLYTLACQVDPKITPEEFLKVTYRTGVPSLFKADGDALQNFGNIANPTKLINVLKKKMKA
jgi:hypothetical protein